MKHTPEIDKDVLVAEFLELLQEIASDKYEGKLEQAFVAWYIEAEFGQDAKWHFTDGASDGGIDALVWIEEEVIVIQSKFSKKIGVNRLDRNMYSKFNEVVQLFHSRSDDEFDRWLNSVHDSNRDKYRKAYEKLKSIDWRHAKKSFHFVTSCRRNADAESPNLCIESYRYDDYILKIYRHYRMTHMPKPKPLVLSVAARDQIHRKHGKEKVDSYLFNARVIDFKDYLTRHNMDVARVVARNIRYNLAKRIGDSIRSTYEKTPDDFWYFHNGITVICDSLNRRGQKLTLENPSVINGAQTLYAIKKSSKSNASAFVTVRVLKSRGGQGYENDRWLQKVIRSVNTQNKVQSLDFFSNEPEQFQLQKLFRSQSVKVYYERKRGEWNEVKVDPRYKSYKKISLPILASILLVTDDSSGHGVLLVKRGLERVFQGREHYDRLFASKQSVQRRFKQIYLAYRLFLFLKDYGYKTPKAARKQQHGFWSCLWLCHLLLTGVKGIPAQCSEQSIKDGFDLFGSNSREGSRARRIIRNLTSEVWKAYRSEAANDRDRWTPNNFFKVDHSSKCLKKTVVPKMRREIQSLAKFLRQGGSVR